MEESHDFPFNTKVSTTFRHDVIKELLKSKFTNSKNKIADEAVDLIAEMARIMVMEAAVRACYEAQSEERTIVTLDDVESLIPQLLLDFP